MKHLKRIDESFESTEHEDRETLRRLGLDQKKRLHDWQALGRVLADEIWDDARVNELYTAFMERVDELCVKVAEEHEVSLETLDEWQQINNDSDSPYDLAIGSICYDTLYTQFDN